MTKITLDSAIEGGEDPRGGRVVVGVDDLGDLLVADSRGRVWLEEHGAGGEPEPIPAFPSMAALRRFLAVQDNLEFDGTASETDLRARRAKLRRYRWFALRSPYAREAVTAALAALNEELADRRQARGRRGRSLARRQALARECERALLDAGAPARWTIGPLAGRSRVLAVLGPLDDEWDEHRLREILEPRVGTSFELAFAPGPYLGKNQSN